MKIALWPAIGKVGSYATGVGKHVSRMATGLAALPGFDIRLVSTPDLRAQDIRMKEASEMDFLEYLPLPFNRRTIEMLWRTVRRPSIDRWVGAVDWVYCPRELYVPVRYARFAVTVHDLYHVEPEIKHSRLLNDIRWRGEFRRALVDADLILAVSEFTCSRIVEIFNIPKSKIRVVGNGVDSGFFDMIALDPEAISPYPKQPYLLAVGGITRKKGGSALLRIAESLTKVAPKLRMVVTGPVEKEFVSRARKIRQLELLDRGFPNQDMCRLVRGASIVLALSEYEGFGIPVLEAMAAGVPVVAACRAALPEVVGDAGVLVEPLESASVFDAVDSLFHDFSFRDDMIHKGRCRAEEYRWSNCVYRLKTALEEFGQGAHNKQRS